jgi:uncharacterized protein YjhX (UPF0386 family)
MNISKHEQRVLHVLAQGGHITHERGAGRKISKILCFTREGMVLDGCTLALFQRLRARGLIASERGRPYQITFLGRRVVRGQPDNQ